MTLNKKILMLLLPGLLVSCHSGHDEEDDHHDTEETHQHSGIVLEPEQAEKFQIEYETVARSKFQEVIKTGGTIESSASDIYTVTAKKAGIVTLGPGLAVGGQVSSGSKIAGISSEGIEGGDISQAALANLAVAKAEYERLKPLYEENLVTASVFHEAERAYKEAEALSGIKTSGGSITEISPLTGTLSELFVTSGQYVEVGAPIATIAKNSRMTLKADLPARYSSRLGSISSANFIPEGSSETFRLSEMDGKKISTGTVSSSQGGYIPVIFSFSGNPQSHPGGYAEVYLTGGEREGVISVPRGALLELQGNKYVYVTSDGHSYEKRIVKTGIDDGERVEILEGLKEGEKIVSKGASIVRMAEVSSIAPPAHTHNH